MGNDLQMGKDTFLTAPEATFSIDTRVRSHRAELGTEGLTFGFEFYSNVTR